MEVILDIRICRLIILLGCGWLLFGCALLTPENVVARVQKMNDFELCLAIEAEMDRHTFGFDTAIVEAAKNQALLAKVDCSQKREEIIKFLVKALRDEELRNLNQRFYFGFGVRGGF